MFRRPETKATEEKVYKQERIGEFMTTWKDFPDQDWRHGRSARRPA